MPQEVLGPLMDAVEHLAPVHILKNEVFPELDSMFHISELDPSEKEAALKGDYAVIIEIPENFTYDLLRNVILEDRKSTRLNSSHVAISYAVFCLKKKKTNKTYASIINYYAYRRQHPRY